jgi:pyruvate,water dikinase
MQIAGAPAIAVALQQQIASDMAGVMFTRNPLTGDAERYIEAGWGLGEAIVAGLIVPDTYRIAADGTVIERTAGEKDVLLIAHKDGKVVEQSVPDDKIEALCLGDAELADLHALATRCQQVYGEKLDIEWAFHNGTLNLLQCRGITR